MQEELSEIYERMINEAKEANAGLSVLLCLDTNQVALSFINKELPGIYIAEIDKAVKKSIIKNNNKLLDVGVMIAKQLDKDYMDNVAFNKNVYIGIQRFVKKFDEIGTSQVISKIKTNVCKPDVPMMVH